MLDSPSENFGYFINLDLSDTGKCYFCTRGNEILFLVKLGQHQDFAWFSPSPFGETSEKVDFSVLSSGQLALMTTKEVLLRTTSESIQSFVFCRER